MKFLAVATLVFGFAAGMDSAPTQLVARDCSAEVAAFNLARREKRGITLDKRTIYQGLQNLTCVLAPEVAKTNYVANAPVRSDITGGQTGLALTLDVGVMDVTTCQPMQNTMVEVWGPNALGNYGNNFLRGSFPTTSSGIAEFQTIFPGFSDGANHLNVAVHQSSSLTSPTAHVGQVFFTDRWTDVITMTAAYTQNTHKRTMNAQDSNYAAANKAGYSAIVDIESIHDDWPEGIVGYITVGINPSHSLDA
ncbi:hypothetical protein V5O48_010587 [Marasmius crinis-equi]|uniref:Aromatic compound dioxygenase n=1 Tax=Marasmius crinis-equi TaxID=585013 RepID=A0ABR3F7X7_9AGAR